MPVFPHHRGRTAGPLNHQHGTTTAPVRCNTCRTSCCASLYRVSHRDRSCRCIGAGTGAFPTTQNARSSLRAASELRCGAQAGRQLRVAKGSAGGTRAPHAPAAGIGAAVVCRVLLLDTGQRAKAAAPALPACAVAGAAVARRHCGQTGMPHEFFAGGQGCTGACWQPQNKTYPREYKPPV